MATRIRKHTDAKKVVRFKRKRRIRGGLSGTQERPRLAVFRSNSHLYLQLINDDKGETLVAVSTLESTNKGKIKNNLSGAKELGKLLAVRALDKKIERAVFDRSGYLYHGRVKAMADAARESGLKF